METKRTIELKCCRTNSRLVQMRRCKKLARLLEQLWGTDELSNEGVWPGESGRLLQNDIMQFMGRLWV